jgi:hypothetical protein
MDAKSSLAVAALSVALHEHRPCALVDAAARVRSAESDLARLRICLSRACKSIEWVLGEGRSSPWMLEGVLSFLLHDLQRAARS